MLGGSPTAAFQWSKNSVPIAGATGPAFALPVAHAADSGSYTVATVASDGATNTSAPVAVTVLGGHLINVSVRAAVSPGAQALIAGFTVTGSGLPLLVRGVGPALSQFGISGSLAAPELDCFSGSASAPFASDTGWANSALMAAAAAQVNAFPYSSGSQDSALLPTVSAGTFTAEVSGSGGTSGTALAEVYDVGLAPASRLINLSGRGQVGLGQNVLVAGFVVGGATPVTILVRGAGPSLAAFGVPGALADPTLSLMDSTGAVIAQNDNWGDAANASGVPLATQAVGAFAFAPGSKDAALLVTLNPGSYTAEVSGVNASTGIGLVELYEVP